MHCKLFWIFAALGILMFVGIKSDDSAPKKNEEEKNDCSKVKCFGQNTCRMVPPPCIGTEPCEMLPLCSTDMIIPTKSPLEMLLKP
ncbi:uncharacterized protein CELE_R11G11.16 [Caenorhabditis elegans]|uniref:Secreted protein n=1 Tax=Caenorhabditis elegans TaxID=6239 RepID=A0A0K3AVT8_CAEEL|nr:Secreted protein [Caenorhabditis elegans]CTQ86872.1 Secreted protein [Caenorhabditis elegans]|eukprot:NP_001300173.1 Uncharacterized protein CELE_R11G11.16 [Caenorhabditis elegans]